MSYIIESWVLSIEAVCQSLAERATWVLSIYVI